MKRYILLLAFIVMFASFAKGQSTLERPKLVIGLVIDQMRSGLFIPILFKIWKRWI